MAPRPKVTVVTRTRERPLFLERAMRSVAGQGFRDFNWVVVNDGGPPDPVNAIAREAEARGLAVAVRHHQRSLGMEAASNAGISACAGEYIAIHDDDDSWLPDFLATTTAELDCAGDCVGVVTQTIEVSEEIRDGALVVRGERLKTAGLRQVHIPDLFVRNLFPPISLLFRRSAWERAGRFDETLPVLGDWEFNLRLVMLGDICVVPRPLARYHHRPKERDGVFGNSVHVGRDLHLRYEAIIRNRVLRAAVADGRLHPGILLALPRVVALATPPRRPFLASLLDLIRRRNGN
jgi:glycosyltransferase involved in cell wall biosynthesis